jgi:hypothetical protein
MMPVLYDYWQDPDLFNRLVFRKIEDLE